MQARFPKIAGSRGLEEGRFTESREEGRPESPRGQEEADLLGHNQECLEMLMLAGDKRVQWE
jgi:hypothetical protein